MFLEDAEDAAKDKRLEVLTWAQAKYLRAVTASHFKKSNKAKPPTADSPANNYTRRLVQGENGEVSQSSTS